MQKKSLLQKGWIRVIVFFVITIAIGIPLYFGMKYFFPALSAENTEQTLPGFLWAYLLANGFVLIPVFICRKWIDKASFGSLGFSIKDAPTQAGLGFFTALFILGVGTLLLIITGNLQMVGLQVDAAQLLYALLLFILVAFVEETVCRGYILQNLMLSVPAWAALVISSLIFALLHAGNAAIGWLPLLNIFIAGLLLGINYIYTKNLWFAICLHFAWNFFQGPVLGYAVSGISINHLFIQSATGPDAVTGGPFGFEGSAIALGLNIAAVILFAFYYNKGFAKAKASA